MIGGLRTRTLAAAFCLMCLAPATSTAQPMAGSMPALSGVKEMLVQDIRFGGDTNKASCGMRHDMLAAHILKTLKDFSLPAVSVLEAKPARIGVPRIDIVPEILASHHQNMECTTWVSLTAQTHNTLRVPPIETARNVIVTYWRANLLVNSLETIHQKAVFEAYIKLIRNLSQQYLMDQPPPLPVIKEKEF